MQKKVERVKKLYVFGAGYGGQEIVRIIVNDLNRIRATWDVVGFIDDLWIDAHHAEPNAGTLGGYGAVSGYPVFRAQDVKASGERYGICGIANPCLRKKVIEEEIEGKGFHLASLVHPSTVKSDDFVAASGLVVFPRVSISYNVKVGKGVFINYHCMLGHDVEIGDYTAIQPSATVNSRCQIGKQCTIGTGATLLPEIVMEDNSLIGAGSTVFTKIKTRTSVTDFPRKITKQIESSIHETNIA